MVSALVFLEIAKRPSVPDFCEASWRVRCPYGTRLLFCQPFPPVETGGLLSVVPPGLASGWGGRVRVGRGVSGRVPEETFLLLTCTGQGAGILRSGCALLIAKRNPHSE